MPKSLVIVESPAKARTIARYLGGDYDVEATMGHIRDLPKKELGVDIENDFEPTYEILPGRKKIVSKLKKKAAGAERIYLAPDLDREGEAIAWHAARALKIDEDRAWRVTFNEITKSAIRSAFENPGRISMDKVNAQQARRLLDRLVGYQISPILWKRIPNVAAGRSGRGLSAGRVQSVAVRLVVEREREIEAFDAKEFWRIAALLAADGVEFTAELEEKNGEKFEVPDKKAADAVLADLEGADFTVSAVEARETRSNPSPPFTTSTLQQAASTRLRFSAKKTMRIAQQLYEGIDIGEEGPTALITYMRTDSVRISKEAIGAIRAHIEENFGKKYLPSKPRSYKSKGTAQEAHEAVRPTYVERTPESLKGELTQDQWKLYDLIWRRAVASQMPPAKYKVTTAAVTAGAYGFTAKGRVVVFDGHTLIAPVKKSEEEILPDLREGQALELVELKPEQKFTQPPARYTEAALVRKLEKEGIGRPSTYAAIISTIQERGYVRMEKRAFKPTPLGVFVTDKLVKHFPRIMNLKFTSHMEEELDQVESGRMDWLQVLNEFYDAFKENLVAAEKEMQSFEETGKKCPECGKQLVKRISKTGMFLGCSGYPECKYTRNLSPTGKDIAQELEGKTCPSCGKPLTLRGGPRGPFVGCTGFPECKYTAPVENPEGGSSEAAEKESGEGGGQAGRTCPQCGEPMVVRSGRRGKFWGCTGFPECRHTAPLEEESAEESAGPDEETPDRKCPNCGKTLVVKNGRRGRFLACPGYPECRYTEPLRGGSAPRKAPEKVGRECPECGRDLVYRTGKRGRFVGCSGFPRCRHTEKATPDG